MKDVVAWIIGIILVLALIGVVIIGQTVGIKDTGEKADIEQMKISRMLDNPNIITGVSVEKYQDSLGTSNVDITYQTGVSSVQETALFEITDRTYDANGDLESIDVTQVDLGN
jgi:hypothetical protein